MFEQTLQFPCPSCKEIINDRAEQCKYCEAPIDKGVAQFAAEVQSKVNQAYSDSSYLKTTAFSLWSFLAFSLIPFMPFVNTATLFIFLALIVMLVRWQLKFANINTSDPDYPKAKRNRNVALVLLVAAIPWFMVRDLIVIAVSNILG